MSSSQNNSNFIKTKQTTERKNQEKEKAFPNILTERTSLPKVLQDELKRNPGRINERCYLNEQIYDHRKPISENDMYRKKESIYEALRKGPNEEEKTISRSSYLRQPSSPHNPFYVPEFYVNYDTAIETSKKRLNK